MKSRTARYLKKSCKFGIEVPTIIQEAEELDSHNGNTLWTDAMEKEIRNIWTAFCLADDGEVIPIGYQCIFVISSLISSRRTSAKGPIGCRRPHY